MKRTLPYFALALLLLASCSPRVITHTVTRDSIVTQIKERVVTDTVGIEIPVETEKNVTRDTASHLSNTYAESDAVVSGGFLHHTLKSKPQTIYVPVEVPVTDTVFYESHANTETITVPAPLTQWQKFRINGFWYLLFGLVLALLWIFRKPLFKL